MRKELTAPIHVPVWCYVQFLAVCSESLLGSWIVRFSSIWYEFPDFHLIFTVSYDLSLISKDVCCFACVGCVRICFWCVHEVSVPNQGACGACATSEKTSLELFGAPCVFCWFSYFQLDEPDQPACGASATPQKMLRWNFEWSVLCIWSFLVTFSLVCPFCVPAMLGRTRQRTHPWHFGTYILCI